MRVSRPLRLQVPGGSYHVVARGNNKQPIFLDERDHHIFLDVVAETTSILRWLCLTYCLMPNHYHLVVTTPNADLSHGMRRINGLYAQIFNRRHDRSGHLFQGRYGGHLIQSDQHLLESIRYVALNPVRAGLVSHPEDWPWSAHSELCGTRRMRLVAAAELLGHFASDRDSAFLRYRQFVRDGEGEPLRSALC
jgi:putative transposase